MAKNLKVGDRVRLRGTDIKGTVVAIKKGPEGIGVKSDAGISTWECEDLLAKLLPINPLREWWINFYPRRTGMAHGSKEDANLQSTTDRAQCVHVREVRRKK